MSGRSLGLIETWGLIPAIEAADAAVKAAQVVFFGTEQVHAGLVTVMFAGEVSAVHAAIAAGKTAAERVGRVVSCLVIPRPDDQIPWKPGAEAVQRGATLLRDIPTPGQSRVAAPGQTASPQMDRESPHKEETTRKKPAAKPGSRPRKPRKP